MASGCLQVILLLLLVKILVVITSALELALAVVLLLEQYTIAQRWHCNRQGSSCCR